MQIDPLPLFVGMFIICACPWLVYAFYLFKGMAYFVGKGLPGVRGFNPLRWQRVRIDRRNDPKVQGIRAQCLKWMKICALTWITSFILLMALVFGLDKAGLLVNSSGHSNAAAVNQSP